MNKNFFSLRCLPNTFPALHGLRSISAQVIMLYHIYPRYFSGIENLWFFMDLFFVLTGFLIGLLLFHDFSTKKNIFRFYIRRTFRIFPLYYFVLISATLFLSAETPIKHNIWQEFAYLTNYYMGTPKLMRWGWSLSLDEHFYILCPLLIILINKIKTRKNQFIALFALWISCLVLRIIIFTNQVEDYNWDVFLLKIYYPTHCRYDELIAGVSLAFVYNYYYEELKIIFENHKYQNLVVIFIALVFSIILIVSSAMQKESILFGFIFCFLMGSVTSVGYVSLFLYLLFVPSKISNFLSKKFFLYVGTLSYGVYLVHLYVLNNVTRPLFLSINIDYPNTLNFYYWLTEYIFTLLISFLIAYILHILVEKPCLIFRDKYFY